MLFRSAFFGTRRIKWPEESLPLMETALEVLERRRQAPPKLQVTIDTTTLFDGERKLGLGSSAAAAVLLTGVLLGQNGADAAPGIGTALFSAALEIHRKLQGGRGSGYDVAASLFGGVLRFSGGEKPEVERVSIPWLPSFYLVPGEAAVHTGGAVEAYRRWKSARPEAAGEFLSHSNALVSRFLDSSCRREGADALREAKSAGEKLGRSIGVDTGFRPPVGCSEEGAVVKPVGAGGELALFFAEKEQLTLPPECNAIGPLRPGERGISWE